MRAKKGSAFEREICKLLSLWWTHGQRDDIFWRSSQSGGRASYRAQKGLKTYGSYGDIAAVDPIGEPLLKLFTIELKRGSSYKIPGDLLDINGDSSKHPWAKCLAQAVEAHKRAGSKSWMLICKRDHRLIMLYMEHDIYERFARWNPLLPVTQFTVCSQYFVAVPFERFLKLTSPEWIVQVLNGLPT